MAKTSKQTKKFQGKHLKDAIKHRKSVQKHVKHKKPKTEAPEKPSAAQKEVFEDMPVDEFFEGGFEVPKDKRKKVEESDDESSDEDLDAMEASMKNLSEKDPEFYDYLKNNDGELLDFEGVNPMEGEPDGSGDESGEEGEVKDVDEADLEDVDEADLEEVEEEAESVVTIDFPTVRKWGQSLKQPTTSKVKKIVVAFRAAVNINSNETQKGYKMTDPAAFSAFVMLVLKKLPVAIQKLAPYKTKGTTRSVDEKHENAGKVAQIVKHHAPSYISLLQDMEDTETAAIVLTSLQELVPWYLPHKRIMKQLVNAVVVCWARSTATDMQMATFAFLNNVAREFGNRDNCLQTVLKGVYSQLLAHARKTTVHTTAAINFCKNSAAELFGVDPVLGYQVGFEYVRQLAVHLRNSINATSNAREGYKTIYNWQFAHAIDFWSRVLALHCTPENELRFTNKESPLRQLIYPLVQVALGAVRLVPTAQFFPFRFYVVRALLRLSQGSGVFIPLLPVLTEVLTSTAVSKAPKSAQVPAIIIEDTIRAGAQYLGTKVYQEAVCEQFVELTAEFFGVYAKSVAFPELATPAILAFRRFTKKSRNARLNKSLNQLVDKLKQNAEFIQRKRSTVEYGPSNKQEVARFLEEYEWSKTPVGEYVEVVRRGREEKLRVLRVEEEEEEDINTEQSEVFMEED